MKKYSENRALDHFDNAYSAVYAEKWKSIRAALLTKHKSVALVNNFADPEKTTRELELSGAINLKSLLEPHRSTKTNQSKETKLWDDQSDLARSIFFNDLGVPFSNDKLVSF